MSFQVNDKVVCVDDVPRAGSLNGFYDFPNGFVRKGQVYVVAGTFDHLTNDEDLLLCLIITGCPCLMRVPTLLDPAGTDVGWASYRFRKLDEVKAENAAKDAMRVAARNPKEVTP